MSRGKRRPDDNPFLAWCLVMGLDPATTTTDQLVDATEALQVRAGVRDPKPPPKKYADDPITGLDDLLVS